ncbi:fungal-specific transcription factor domain-containing protein [Penicillium angulare]|uniref:fungal-specific transcription factor domain-containing protein n=1 Tax=Penicillium angulare TaxID=116970 RepID=UPI00253FCE03|nr:fungal-specific transcription factor domain-containing protein [Penicillium angulare]KAJ5266729.1 fungal-specific transcription factor domain-containing protein [Penicillium angulare]
MDPPRMRISCRRCQIRKLKCTRVDPCRSCIASGSECSFRDDDARRRPVSRARFVALEERVASYETILRKLREATPEQRQAILDDLSINEETAPVSSFNPATPIFDYSGSSRLSTTSLQPGPKGYLSFYGPTSIYQKDCITEKIPDNGRSLSNRTSEQWQGSSPLSPDIDFQEVGFHEGLSKFFFYLGTECIFVDQSLFTNDWLNQEHSDKYWSYPLLYSLGSLGIRLGGEPAALKDADSLAHCAHETLSASSLETPHLTVVQSLLALAFIELGAANHTKGWMLSGMACRMAQDLGLHQDPRFLAGERGTINSESDFLPQRRVYWGCYVADKIISLFFGRPIMLHDTDTAVDPPNFKRTTTPTEELRDLRTPDSIPSSIEYEINNPSAFVQLVELARIIESVITLVFSPKMIKSPRKKLVTSRIASVEALNLQLFRWHSSIPEDLTWNRWTPNAQKMSPQIATMHALYHSTLISLNRHFIRPTPGFARRSQSREICIASAESILAIIRQYKTNHSLENAPLTLVYSTVMAATAVSFALDGTTHNQNQMPPERETYIKSLRKALTDFSAVYRVAADASARLEEKLEAGCQGKPAVAAEGATQVQEKGEDIEAGSLFEFLSWEEPTILGNNFDESSDFGMPGFSDLATECPSDADHRALLALCDNDPAFYSFGRNEGT